MMRLVTGSVLLLSVIVISGCQTWHSPYRGSQWRMDQVMDGDPYREGDGNHAANGTGNFYIRR